jgi:hypothetical protein
MALTDSRSAEAQAAILYEDTTKDGLSSRLFQLPNDYRVSPHAPSKTGLFTTVSNLPCRDGRDDRSEQSESHAVGKLHRPCRDLALQGEEAMLTASRIAPTTFGYYRGGEAT